MFGNYQISKGETCKSESEIQKLYSSQGLNAGTIYMTNDETSPYCLREEGCSCVYHNGSYSVSRGEKCFENSSVSSLHDGKRSALENSNAVCSDPDGCVYTVGSEGGNKTVENVDFGKSYEEVEGERLLKKISGFMNFATKVEAYDSENNNVLGTTSSDSNSLGTGYITYLPEYGFFDLEIEGLVEGQKVEGGEGNLRMFYVEMNGKSGLQLPADPDNPQVGEDIVLRTNALNITYKKSAEVMTLNVKKGVNLISFSYLPQIKTDEYTKASDVILWLRSKGVKAENLSYFSAGRWRGIGYVDGEVTGEDFSITPGRGYLLYSLDDGQVSIPGYQLTSSVPISLSIGWNLVGIHGYSKVYTARSLLNSINKVEGLTANNISWWPTSKGKYEGLQLTDGKEYGFDFPISPNNGYFIRINKFEPKDTSCGSILWHEGGTHNGVCGDSKTL